MVYIPRKFALTDEQTAAALAAADFAQLVSHDPSGMSVTPLPLMYDESSHSLIGHVSRANPHWHADGAESVAIFSGPHTYISPSFYVTKAETGKVVPTWNYVVAHAHGVARAIENHDWMLNMLNRLTDTHEARRSVPWSIGDAPSLFIDKLMRAIVGIEIPIDRLEGKLKASQDEAMHDRLGTVRGLHKENCDESSAMADLVVKAIEADAAGDRG